MAINMFRINYNKICILLFLIFQSSPVYASSDPFADLAIIIAAILFFAILVFFLTAHANSFRKITNSKIETYDSFRARFDEQQEMEKSLLLETQNFLKKIESLGLREILIEEYFYWEFKNIENSKELEKLRLELISIDGDFDVLEQKFKDFLGVYPSDYPDDLHKIWQGNLVKFILDETPYYGNVTTIPVHEDNISKEKFITYDLRYFKKRLAEVNSLIDEKFAEFEAKFHLDKIMVKTLRSWRKSKLRAETIELIEDKSELIFQNIRASMEYDEFGNISYFGDPRASLSKFLHSFKLQEKIHEFEEDIALEYINEIQASEQISYSILEQLDYQDVNVAFNELLSFFKDLYHKNETAHADADFDATSFPLNGFEFERWVSNSLNKFGWDVRTTKETGDQGVDVIASKNAYSVAIQCKRFSKPVGNKAVQEILAGQKHYSLTHAVVIASSSFTKSASELARSTGVILATVRDIPNLYELIESAEDR